MPIFIRFRNVSISLRSITSQQFYVMHFTVSLNSISLTLLYLPLIWQVLESDCWFVIVNLFFIIFLVLVCSFVILVSFLEFNKRVLKCANEWLVIACHFNHLFASGDVTVLHADEGNDVSTCKTCKNLKIIVIFENVYFCFVFH